MSGLPRESVSDASFISESSGVFDQENNVAFDITDEVLLAAMGYETPLELSDSKAIINAIHASCPNNKHAIDLMRGFQSLTGDENKINKTTLKLIGRKFELSLWKNGRMCTCGQMDKLGKPDQECYILFYRSFFLNKGLNFLIDCFNTDSEVASVATKDRSSGPRASTSSKHNREKSFAIGEEVPHTVSVLALKMMWLCQSIVQSGLAGRCTGTLIHPMDNMSPSRFDEKWHYFHPVPLQIAKHEVVFRFVVNTGPWTYVVTRTVQQVHELIDELCDAHKLSLSSPNSFKKGKKIKIKSSKECQQKTEELTLLFKELFGKYEDVVDSSSTLKLRLMMTNEEKATHSKNQWWQENLVIKGMKCARKTRPLSRDCLMCLYSICTGQTLNRKQEKDGAKPMQNRLIVQVPFFCLFLPSATA